MSIYGYLCCHDCRQMLWLGKAVYWDEPKRAYFHIGGVDEPLNWLRTELNQVIWKFLGEHTSHRIDTRLEHDLDDDMWGYQEIGGDDDNSASFAAYLEGWPGLRPSSGS